MTGWRECTLLFPFLDGELGWFLRISYGIVRPAGAWGCTAFIISAYGSFLSSPFPFYFVLHGFRWFLSSFEDYENDIGFGRVAARKLHEREFVVGWARERGTGFEVSFPYEVAEHFFLCGLWMIMVVEESTKMQNIRFGRYEFLIFAN